MQALDNNYNNKNKKRKNVGGAPAFTFMSGTEREERKP
ncbi:WSSV209 [White spot syndrome virus]|uniref:WSSV209 n=1 Tax=White spot syndrome virus TaxID=342409 RepID=A0A2I6SBV2_9VIRU|nr:WSSV209 [White spot syndrome virus]